MSYLCNESERIPQLEFPGHLIPILNSIQAKMVEAIERGGVDIEAGTIPLGKVEKEHSIPYLLFLWMAENNDVIDNLNMILWDMELLGSSMFRFKGSPEKRFYLLVRTYFHEFYRVREIFSQVVKGLEVHGLVNKNSVSKMRKIFHDAFQDTIKIRNKLVHGYVQWKGREHVELTLVGVSYELGWSLYHKESGKICELQSVIKQITHDYLQILTAEGCRMRNIIQSILDYWANLIEKA